MFKILQGGETVGGSRMAFLKNFTDSKSSVAETATNPGLDVSKIPLENLRKSPVKNNQKNH